MKKFVGYYRDFKATQGLGGMNLDAQIECVKEYVSFRGELIKEFTEDETGIRKKKRIEIYKAIEWAKKENAVMIVSKLDRLVRDVQFTSALLYSDVEFICCDYAGVNNLTIQIISVIAENEAKIFSNQIKAGLKAKKARIESKNYTNKDGSYMKTDNKGKFRLGNPNGFKTEHQQLGVQKIKENALNDKSNRRAMKVVFVKRKQGFSYQEIATYLNKSGYTTRYGKEFNPIQAQRLFKRSLFEASKTKFNPQLIPQ